MRKEILRMERVTYREQGMTQLENFNIAIKAGEIIGMVPVNHVGLAAFIRLLQQNLPLHYGYVYYQEKMVNHWRFPTMKYNRISVIQNRSSLAGGLTVADNVFVLRQGFRKCMVQPKVLRQQLQPFLEEIGVDISADAYVDELSAFEKLVVELLKAVVAGNRLIVMDDICTFVSDRELKKLHEIMRHYASEGVAFLYIAAHFEDARQICDRIAMLMNGQIIKYYSGKEPVPKLFYFQCTEEFDRKVRKNMERKRPRPEERPVFEAKGICGENLKNLAFSVRSGECLVLQALDNAVFQELTDLVTGVWKPDEGTALVDGFPVRFPGDRRIGVIRELPAGTMVFSNMSYMDNLCFSLDHRFPDMWRRGSIKKSVAEEYGSLLGRDVFWKRVDELTEMEKYDLVYARILLQNPRTVFCIQPFKGAEVELRVRIWEHLEMFLDRGMAVVILAVNLADSLALANRLIRIRKGGRQEEFSREAFNRLPINTPWRYLYEEEG